MKNFKGAISLVLFSRPEISEKCLESLTELRRSAGISLFVLHQVNDDKINLLVEKYRNQIDLLIQVKNQSKKPMQNINQNRIIANDLAFKLFQADYLVSVEEDIEIGLDVVSLAEFSLKQFGKKLQFRGINLGSRNTSARDHSYALVRSCLHGQGHVVTIKLWKKWRKITSKYDLKREPFDACIEGFTFSGFVVNPLRSRIKDNGWSGEHGAGVREQRNREIENSFVNLVSLGKELWTFSGESTLWREDVRNYSLLKTPAYKIRNMLSKIRMCLLRKLRIN